MKQLRLCVVCRGRSTKTSCSKILFMFGRVGNSSEIISCLQMDDGEI